MLQHRIKNLFVWTRNWYARFERPISSISLVGGFVFDALTLKRVDTFWENFWVLAHLAIVGICIILINRDEEGDMKTHDPARLHFWLVNILQFFFGGLLSTYLVFYFRSATFSVAWPFLFLLAAAFVANESFKKHYARLTFQISLFYLSLYSFAIFLVPVVLHTLGPWIFLLSGVLSIVLLRIFLRVLRFFTKGRFDSHRKNLFIIVSVIFISVNALYFLNLIPPIPLSLKDAGIYHSISRNLDGDYVVEYEDNGFWSFLYLYEEFHATTFDSVNAYSAIFSPSSFHTDIIHEWQQYNQVTKTWETLDRVELPVIGGREDGFRTYSTETGLTPGKWRVNVKTLNGQLIGRLRFMIVPPSTSQIVRFQAKK